MTDAAADLTPGPGGRAAGLMRRAELSLLPAGAGSDQAVAGVTRAHAADRDRRAAVERGAAEELAIVGRSGESYHRARRVGGELPQLGFLLGQAEQQLPQAERDH